MKRALVLFGSVSDQYIYDDIISELKKEYLVDFQVISAHRNPEDLKDRLDRDDFDFIIAGAGLAAHLPGVCASLTKRPVFGVYVPANFSGLDSLLSILQMPFGVPVATLNPNNIDIVTKVLKAIDSRDKKSINIVVGKEVREYESTQSELKRLSQFGEENGVFLNINENFSDVEFNIVLAHHDFKKEMREDAFYIPLLNASEKKSPSYGLKILERVDNGAIWFGVNNSRNALKFYLNLRGE